MDTALTNHPTRAAPRKSSPRTYSPLAPTSKPTALPEESNLPPIRQIPSHNKRHLLLPQLLDSNLQRVCLALYIHQHRRIHTKNPPTLTLAFRQTTPPKPPTKPSRRAVCRGTKHNIPNLQRPRAQHPCALILRHIRRRRPLLCRDPLALNPLHTIHFPRGSRGGRGRVPTRDDVVGVVCAVEVRLARC